MKVAGRGDCHETLPAWPDADGDHVLGQAFLVANAGVVTGADDVDEGVVHVHFQRDARVASEKTVQQLRQDVPRDHAGHMQAQ